MHVVEAIEGFVRAEARKTRRQVRVRTAPGIGAELEVVLGILQDREDDRRWFDELEDQIADGFGVDVRVKLADPSEWLLALD